MRLFRPLLAAAAIGTVLIGTAGATAARPLPPTPQQGEDPAVYLCRLAHYVDPGASCDDIPCGPKSCDVVDTAAYRASY
ncbi:MAG: hypothetical protein JWO22_2456 [Frankiales bacterium]|nr:hypothetical protein [Frankiales bacterium]